jgi:hypothetical protein
MSAHGYAFWFNHFGSIIFASSDAGRTWLTVGLAQRHPASKTLLGAAAGSARMRSDMRGQLKPPDIASLIKATTVHP